MGRSRLTYPVTATLLYPAAFLSGATALLYEIVWARRLALTLGSTTSAAAAVLAAFMLGLALGALLLGTVADRIRRPLLLYGLLELGLGACALAFRSLVPGLGASGPGAFVLLLVPAALMGGTLPMLARAGADTTERGARAFGGLYGLNTLGAVAGALFTTLFAMERFGWTGAERVAAGVNFALGAVFVVLGRRVGGREVYAEREERTGRFWTGDAGALVLFVFFAAGFAALALEVAWIRLLVFFLEGFTLAFGLMLAAYLLGLGAGALAGTWLALRSQNPRRLLGRVLLGAGLASVATFLLVTSLGDGLEAMRVKYVTAAGIDNAYKLHLFWFAAAVVCPGTFLTGMLMPVVARVTLSDRESIGRHTGVVYAVSTLGAVLAPPVAGFWLVPAFGVPGTIALMAGLLLLGGTLLALGRGLQEWILAGAAAVVFVAVCLAAGLGEPLVMRSHVFRAARSPRHLLDYRTGLQAGVSVVEELRDGSRRLYLDGFSAAETGPHYGYMRMLGHLPVLLHAAPRDVCVVAVGTGTTAGAAASHEEVRRVVCVEIEPAVYDVAGRFAEQNRGVFDLSKTERVVADGREYLGRAPGRFDVVTLEPLMPYTPAAIHLYTREFYEVAHGALRQGGLVCQWIPPQGVSNADLRRLLASVTAVFRYVSVWYFPHALVVVGGDEEPRLDRKKLLARCSSREVVEDLRLARVGDLAHLLGAHVCSGDALVAALDGAEPFDDEHPDLEFRPLPRGLGRLSRTYHAENLAFLARIHEDEVAWVAAGAEGADTALRTGGAVLETLALEWRRRIEGGKIVPAAALDAALEADPDALFANQIRDRRLYAERVARGEYDKAAALELAPDKSRAYLELAGAAEGKERIFYLTLAVRESALLDVRHPEASASLLDELAGALDGAHKRFCLNRARALRGEPLEPGEESRPEIELPDLRAALDAWDEAGAAAILERARYAGIATRVDRQCREWFREAKDKRRALGLLDRIGSSHVLYAAVQVMRGGRPEDRAAVAPVFAARSLLRWTDLARDPSPLVREAAADAAKAVRDPRQLPVLAGLCADPAESVRLSAIIAFREQIADAERRTHYDYRQPTPESIAALRRLAGGS